MVKYPCTFKKGDALDLIESDFVQSQAGELNPYI